MARFLKTLFLLPLALAAVVFAVTNRQTALVSLWPLPFEIATPVFFLVLAPLGLGLVLGAVFAWLAGGKRRRLAREQSRQIKKLEKAAATAAAASSSSPPSIPSASAQSPALLS